MESAELLKLIRLAHRGDPHAELASLGEKISAGDHSAPGLRRAAWLAAVCGDWEGAEAYLQRAKLEPGDGGEACFAFGLLRLARDDHESARAAFLAAAKAFYLLGEERTRKRAELRAYDPALNRFAVFSIFYGLFESSFCCFLLASRVQPAEFQPYDFCVARACAFMGHSAVTEALLEGDRKLNGETTWYHVNMGHYRWLNDDHDAADRHFRQARELAIRHCQTPYHFNCGTLVWLTYAESLSLLTEPEPTRQISTETWDLNFGESPPPQAETVIVVGCDRRYFTFFPKFLLSVLRAHSVSGGATPTALHCHLADPEPDQIAFLKDIQHELSLRERPIRLSFGLSQSPFREASYYTCLRFLTLPAVLNFYGCGALVMDIDSELEPAFFERREAIAKYDAGLRMYSFDPNTRRQVGAEPWSIGAHPTYVSATPPGRKFAAFLGAYIRAAYDPSLVTNWTIDQCAIARGYDLIFRPMAEQSVLNFAQFEAISRLPSGSKAEFLMEGGLTDLNNFRERAAAYLG